MIGESSSPAKGESTIPRFIVEAQHVTEVSLTGQADLSYWQARLQPHGLFPFTTTGRAAVVISATALYAMGRHTNELTIGVPACERPAGDTFDGMFLVQAFNSSRLFAWIERTFFATPYDLGRIELDDQVPARIVLSDAEGPVIRLQQAAGAVTQHSQGEDWQGPIFLPRRRAGDGGPGQYFAARLAGLTEVYAADATTVQLMPRPQWPAVQWLLDSGWVPETWRIRRDAVHARSRTFERPPLEQSARLYSEIYAQDAELQSLTEAAIQDWPE
jgi:hypothetical protein